MTANHSHKGTFMGYLLPVSYYQLEVSPGRCRPVHREALGLPE
ncbi:MULTISPECIES: hypothetical protein [Arthrobacter]|nr:MULTISPECIES: hypothetical protein [Arthrobacter]